MILTIAITFAVLLLLSTPIAVIMLGVTATALLLHTKVPLTALVQQVFNGLDSFILLAIPFFVLAGNIMASGRISHYLVEVMNLLVGRFRGGLAYAAILSCLFFAAISGSSPATVIAIGTLMIPALLKNGYGENFSIGLVTSSGALGILIPPSIPMVLYALVVNVSVGDMFMAGVTPGIFQAGILCLFTYWMARRYGWFNKRTYEKGQAAKILLRSSWGLAMPLIVLGGIYTGFFTPTEAGAVSVIYALLVEIFIYREMTWAKFNDVLYESVLMSAALLFILACAMAFIWLLTREQIPLLAADFIVNTFDNKYTFLLAVNLLLLVVGCLMDIVSAILILSPIFVPALMAFNIDLVHYGIIMIINVELGFLTFPFGLNLFVSMGLTGKPLIQIAKSVLPFLCLYIGCLLMLMFLPDIVMWLPRTLR